MANATTSTAPEASRQVDGLFRNHAPVQREGFRKMMRILWNMIFHKPRDTRPTAAVPVQRLTHDALIAAPNHSVYRLGHSTVLLKLQDKFSGSVPSAFTSRRSAWKNCRRSKR